MLHKLILAAVTVSCICLGSLGTIPASGQEPVDGPNRIFRDELLEKLAGNWKLTRRIRREADSPREIMNRA